MVWRQNVSPLGSTCEMETTMAQIFYTRSSSSKYNRIVCRKQCKQACKFMPYRAQATTLPTECTLQNASHISLVLSRRQTSQCKISNTRSTLSHNNRTKFNPCLFNKRMVLCNTKYNALYYVRLPITKKSKCFFIEAKWITSITWIYLISRNLSILGPHLGS